MLHRSIVLHYGCVDLAQVAAALSLVASTTALVTAVGAVKAIRAARHMSGNTEIQLDRISHQLATLDQAWYWTSAWQSGEAQADIDLAEGHGTTYYSDKDFLDGLRAIPAADMPVEPR